MFAVEPAVPLGSPQGQALLAAAGAVKGSALKLDPPYLTKPQAVFYALASPELAVVSSTTFRSRQHFSVWSLNSIFAPPTIRAGRITGSGYDWAGTLEQGLGFPSTYTLTNCQWWSAFRQFYGPDAGGVPVRLSSETFVDLVERVAYLRKLVLDANGLPDLGVLQFFYLDPFGLDIASASENGCAAWVGEPPQWVPGQVPPPPGPQTPPPLVPAKGSSILPLALGLSVVGILTAVLYRASSSPTAARENPTHTFLPGRRACVRSGPYRGMCGRVRRVGRFGPDTPVVWLTMPRRAGRVLHGEQFFQPHELELR